jgi:hypothetical protein
VLVRKTASTAYIRWASTIDEITPHNQGDARYEVDRGRWKVMGARRGDPLNIDDPLAKLLKKLRAEGFRPLTSGTGDGSIDDADAGKTQENKTEEEDEMTEMSKAAKEREAAQKQIANGGLKDRETYTAKQVATRCGTDAKTMRKFFRSAHSTVEPVGQGGRYEFAAKDLSKIQKEFKSWSKRAAERNTRPVNNAPHEEVTLEQVASAIERAQETEDLEPELTDDEPTEDDLEELEDLELDLDDLDALED